jgi:hypothetical protein
VRRRDLLKLRQPRALDTTLSLLENHKLRAALVTSVLVAFGAALAWAMKGRREAEEISAPS